MKQFAIIGIGTFGLRMIEDLSKLDCEILIIDKKRDVIEALKDKVTRAYVANVVNKETILKLVPATVDAAILDFGDSREVSILVTSYLKRLGIKNIIAKAETDEHGEILEMVGATYVVYPNREAARVLVPILGTSLLFNYTAIGSGLAIAEIKAPAYLKGKSLIEADLRNAFNVNIIAARKRDVDEVSYELFPPDRFIQNEDIFLVVGSENNIAKFLKMEDMKGNSILARAFQYFFSRDKHVLDKNGEKR